MQNIPIIDIDNLKEAQDAYTLIDLLISGYKQAIKENDEIRKIAYRNGTEFSDIRFAKYSAFNNSFNSTIVLLEKLEKQIDKIDKEHIVAENMAGGF